MSARKFLDSITILGTAPGGRVGAVSFDFLAASDLPSLDGITAPAADVSLNSHKITNLASGTASTDAATYGQLTTLINGAAWKAPVLVLAHSNVTLSGEQTIDGVLTSASRVGVVAQSTASQNGIYTTAAGAWARVADLAAGSGAASIAFFVEKGTTYADTQWICTSDPGADVVGTNSLAFSQFGSATSYSADESTVHLSGTTFSIISTYVGQASITTLGTITTGTWSATTVAVNKGGTGQTSYTDGQLLIGNSAGNTLTKATLTAGSGISVTNAGGSITIAATGAGTVTSITAGTGLSGGTISTTGTIAFDPNSLTAADPALADQLAGYDASAAAVRKFEVDYLLGLQPAEPGGRISGAQATPVTNTDLTALTTLYYCPYKHDRVTIWDGTRWVTYQFQEIGIALGTMTSGIGYDLFIFASSATPSSTNTATDVVTFGSAPGWQTGAMVTPAATAGGLTAGTVYWYSAVTTTTGSFYDTLAHAITGGATGKIDLTANVTQSLAAISLEKLAWTNSSSRATAVTLQDGRYCKSGDKTRLYLGSFFAESTTTTSDTSGQAVGNTNGRYVWNMYSRVWRAMHAIDATNTWTYTLAAWRAANNDTNNRVQWFRGLDEDAIAADVHANASNSAAGATNAGVGIGIGSATVNSAQVYGGQIFTTINTRVSAHYGGCPGIGFNYAQWLEQSTAAGVTTWIGDAGLTTWQTGLTATGWF